MKYKKRQPEVDAWQNPGDSELTNANPFWVVQAVMKGDLIANDEGHSVTTRRGEVANVGDYVIKDDTADIQFFVITAEEFALSYEEVDDG